MINSYLNHITWILNALKEHNKILNQYFKQKNSLFSINKDFQQAFYTFTIYLKLSTNIEKGYRLILSSNKINKKALLTLKNTYINRLLFQFKNLQNQLNSIKYDISEINNEIKKIASNLILLESDLNTLIMNLY